MSPLSEKHTGHVVIHAGSVFLALTAQVISVLCCYLAKDSNVPNALFQTSSRNVSETFPLEVTMDWWADIYWIMVDLWSVAWLLYAVASIFKSTSVVALTLQVPEFLRQKTVLSCYFVKNTERNVFGSESCNPEIHPPVFYLMWTMISIARMCSMTRWDRHDILGAVILEAVLPVLSFSILYMSYSNLNRHKDWLAINNPQVISWTRYLTQNGLAAFSWWSVLNAMVGLGIVLKYKAGVPDPLVSTIVLTIICLCSIIWFILQSFLLNKYMRYTFTVYAILVLSLGAMFTRSYRVHDLAANTVFCGFLMLLMTILSLIHLISACLHTDQSRKPVSMEPYVTFESCETVWHTHLRSGEVKESKI